MAGEWIKVERSTPDKPEVLRIARELVIDRDAVFGKLMLIWMWFDVNSYNGVVDGAVDADIDAVARYDGFAAQMRAVGWLTDALLGNGLCIPNFNRHNGETTKRRALSNRRQAKWRNARVDALPSTNASTREEKRREEKNKEEKPIAPSAPALSAGNGDSVAYIPLNDGSEFGVSAEQVSEFEKLYPAVDVLQTLNEIRGWNLANPSRRKTRRGVLSHVNGWLSKEQNRGPQR